MPKHILVVEDDEMIRELLDELLGEEGYLVSTTDQVLTSLAPLLLDPPDLIILDDFMWGAFVGVSTLHRLRAEPRLADIAVIICTGGVNNNATTTAVAAELKASIIFKPFDLDQLLDGVALSLALPTTTTP